jgi:hypothetical protein
VFAAYQAGVLIPLLAGLLREHGRDWSIDGAAESCALFARTTDANDHRTLFRAFAAGFERLAGHEGRIRELASQPLVDTRFRFSHTFSDEFSHKD